MLQRELLIDSINVPLCLHIYAPDAHMQSVLMYRSQVCVSVDKICESNVYQGYKSPPSHTGGLAAGARDHPRAVHGYLGVCHPGSLPQA